MRCDASSDDRATALPVIYLVLISTYQVSSAWLECRALQRKIVKVLMCRPGIEPGTSHLPGECSTTELPTPLYYLCSPEHILLNFRHPCMRCDASSDGRATALPVIYISSHFDLGGIQKLRRQEGVGGWLVECLGAVHKLRQHFFSDF